MSSIRSWFRQYKKQLTLWVLFLDPPSQIALQKVLVKAQASIPLKWRILSGLFFVVGFAIIVWIFLLAHVTVMGFPLQNPLLFLGIGVVYVWASRAAYWRCFVVHVFKARRDLGEQICARCGYQLAKKSETCPECGQKEG
jgi:hypothetical protein